MNKNANHRLPSLNILRVFESAARHLSFKKAAQELFITPPAVSHQIRALEEQLEIELFTRFNRSIVLNDAGQAYFAQVQNALQQLQSATNELTANKEKSTFTINTVPMVVSNLLAPHIHLFQKNEKNFNIQIDSDPTRADFTTENLDIAIRHKAGSEPNLIYVPIFKIKISPICSPKYLSRNPDINLSTLENSRLIRTTIDMPNWPFWLKQWGLNAPQENELLLNSFRSVVEAAQSGAGLAMGYLPIIKEMIEDGEVVLPFKDKISSYGEACLVYRKKDKNKPIIKAFEQWLKALVVELGWSDK